MRITLKSVVLLLVFVFGVPGLSMAQSPQIEGHERQAYLDSIKQRHDTQDEREALIAQINALLKDNALLAGYQVGYSNPQDILYSVSVPRVGELSIREQTREPESGKIQVSTRTINVFGVNPFFDYDCTLTKVDCSITHSEASVPLLRVIRQAPAAQELVKALSYLMRNLQRGG